MPAAGAAKLKPPAAGALAAVVVEVDAAAEPAAAPPKLKPADVPVEAPAGATGSTQSHVQQHQVHTMPAATCPASRVSLTPGNMQGPR